MSGEQLALQVEPDAEVIAPSGGPSPTAREVNEPRIRPAPAAPAPAADAPPADTVTPPVTPVEAPAPSPEEQARSRIQRQRDAANRRYGQEKARADFLAAEIEKLRPKPAAVEGAPKLEQFNDIEAYAEAKANFVKEQALKEFQTKQQQDRTQNVVQKIEQDWNEKAAEAEERWPDFNDVVGELKPTNPLTAALMRNDPAIAYHLGTHPAEARKLAAMEPIDQLFSLGKLAAKLEAEPAVAKQPSKAPAPIAPLTGKAAAVSDAIEPDDDMRTFIRKRNRQLGRK